MQKHPCTHSVNMLSQIWNRIHLRQRWVNIEIIFHLWIYRLPKGDHQDPKGKGSAEKPPKSKGTYQHPIERFNSRSVIFRQH